MTSPIGFLFLLLTTSQLTARLSAFNPEWGTIPLYQILIISCLVFSMSGILQELTADALSRNPITTYLLGFLLCFFLSAMANHGPADGLTHTIEALKAVLYYLAVVANLQSRSRLLTFSAAYVAFMVIVVGFGIANFFFWLDLPGYARLGEPIGFDRVARKVIREYRLCGPAGSPSGDPNDFCLTILPAIFLAGHAVVTAHSKRLRLLALAVSGFLFWGVVLTKSRGGLLGLMVGVSVYIWCRYGTKRAVVLVSLVIAALLSGVGGRQAELSTQSGTGKVRIQVWLHCFDLMKMAPVVGVGPYRMGNYSRYIAHNSYLQAFTEVGLAGGILFTGVFLSAVWVLYEIRKIRVPIADPELWRHLPVMLAILAGCMASMSSLSRTYTVETYTFVGVASAYYSCVTNGYRDSPVRTDLAMHARIVAGSMLYLFFVRLQCLRSI
jgi:O-antigen ligase